MPTRWVAALFGGFMVLLGVAFRLVPDAQDFVRLVASAAAVAAVAAGLRRHQPVAPLAWHLLMVAVGVSAVGATAYRTRNLIPAFAVIGPVLTGVGYVVLAAALATFVRRVSAGTRDRAGLLDALILTAGVALLMWSFGPRLSAEAVGGVVCFAAATRLLTSPGRTITAGHILAAGVLFLPGYSGKILFYAAAGLAATHPSMIRLTTPGAPLPAETSRRRLALLGLASLVAPGVLLARVIADHLIDNLGVVAGLSVLTFLLVLVRAAEIMGNHRQALTRERALREASAALVSSVDTGQVGDAVRIAVAHLLPADVPHGVVLALAVPESDHRSTEDPTARTVATRDLDWGVGVRLTQFSAVLRCPMVVRDRLTGDPLVGVLHVGAPQWALPGLHRAIEVLAGQAALAIERIGLSEEVTRRNSEVYFRTLVQNTSDVILIVDAADRIRYASPSAVTVFGGDPTGLALSEVFDVGDHVRLAGVLQNARGGDALQLGLDFRVRCDHRAEVLVEMDCRDLRADESVAGLVITLRDVTERRRLERELTHQAFHDALTGLANRKLFADRLEHALARAARDGSMVGVLFIDLDDFKTVNDTLGHAAGDVLLKAVAERISGALRADDTAARLGGDEFAALIENVWDAAAVEDTAQRILTAFAAPVPFDGDRPLQAVASIGITTTPEADTADELLRQADLALYVAKGAGKNRWRRYQRHLHDAMVARLELRSALGHAVNEGHFLLQYQPIVSLSEGDDRIVGFEALVRWAHPTQGVIAPKEFIDVAEESGLIVPIGRWVLDQALHTLGQWHRVLPRARRPYMSVNVSVRQLLEGDFVEQVMQSLAYAEVPPGALMLELTETLLTGDHETIWRDLSALREQGVRVAIDDFGTGYSSLAYLRQRPVDVVKIDKVFVDDMAGNEQLVGGIIGLARSQGLDVIAEGIESPLHRELLIRLGCPLGQGFLFSSPVDGTEAISQMTNRQPLAA
jgi:diguanylate cyclase (GGDEF)-like protein/PAS domain S-box-containing protein